VGRAPASEDLPHVGDWFPVSYFQVKESLGQHARQESILDNHDYRTLCEQHTIPKEEEQGNMLQLLDAIGVVVVYDATTLLDPNWLTTAVYRLLTHSDVAKANGEFAFRDIGQLLTGLTPEQYPPSRWPFIVEMMKRFGLCFDLRDCDHPRYLVPEQLSPNGPETNFDEKQCLRFRFDYDALPHGLIPQFIVQAHDLLTEKRTVWANGAVLRTNDCQVLVRGDHKRNQVHLFVDGLTSRRRSALAVIRDRFAMVHKLNQALNPKEMVPLPDHPEVAAEYLWLVQLEDNRQTYCWPPGATRQYLLDELLNGVDEGSRRRPILEDEDARRGSDRAIGEAYVQAIKARDRQARVDTPPAATPTFAIITALPHETDAVRTVLGEPPQEYVPGPGAGRTYWRAQVRSADGGEHEVIVAQADMGTNSAAIRASLLLAHFHSVE
jgi:hypothetical protein